LRGNAEGLQRSVGTAESGGRPVVVCLLAEDLPCVRYSKPASIALYARHEGGDEEHRRRSGPHGSVASAFEVSMAIALATGSPAVRWDRAWYGSPRRSAGTAR